MTPRKFSTVTKPDTVTLLGGPWNHCQVENDGAVRIHMMIYEHGKPVVGAKFGSAIYEHSSAESPVAFWLENSWDGILERIIEA